jgi:hypothetical protein
LAIAFDHRISCHRIFSERAMKKILIATALAGAIVGTFASISFAATVGSHPAAAIITVDHR